MSLWSSRPLLPLVVAGMSILTSTYSLHLVVLLITGLRSQWNGLWISEPQPSSQGPGRIFSSLHTCPAFYTLDGTTATWWPHILRVGEAPSAEAPNPPELPVSEPNLPLSWVGPDHWWRRTPGLQRSLTFTRRKGGLWTWVPKKAKGASDTPAHNLRQVPTMEI